MINLDQLEREARSRLALALSNDVARHMAEMLPRLAAREGVLRWCTIHGEIRSISVQPIATPRASFVQDVGPMRLEMLVDQAMAQRLLTDWMPVNFERYGIPGAWSLHEQYERACGAKLVFTEVLPA